MTTAGTDIWRSGDGYDLDSLAISLQKKGGPGGYKPEIIDVIEATIDLLSDELRELSLSIHGKCSVCCILIRTELFGFM